MFFSQCDWFFFMCDGVFVYFVSEDDLNWMLCKVVGVICVGQCKEVVWECFEQQCFIGVVGFVCFY